MAGFGTIAVGVRCGCGTIDPSFFESYTRLLIRGLKHGDTILAPARDLPHHIAANVLAYEFTRDCKADTLLMLDDDMTFEPEDLVALREHPENADYAVVSGLYVTRRPPHHPILLIKGTGEGQYCCNFPGKDDTTVTAAVVGLGFTLIRREAFAAVDSVSPKGVYFKWADDGSGEDAYFCQHVIGAGLKVGVDTRVNLGHRMKIEVKWKTAERKAAYMADANDGLRLMLTNRKEA